MCIGCHVPSLFIQFIHLRLFTTCLLLGIHFLHILICWAEQKQGVTSKTYSGTLNANPSQNIDYAVYEHCPPSQSYNILYATALT